MLFLPGVLIALAALCAGGAPHDPEGVIAELTRRIARAPQDVDLRVMRSRALAAAGEIAAARADAALALRLSPDHGAANAAMALVEYRSGNDVATLQFARRAQALGIADPELSRLRGRSLRALGRDAEAAATLAAALASDRRSEPEHFLELARAWTKVGDDANAIAVLERGLAQLGPAIALVDAAVDLDVRAGRHAVALARLDTLRPFVQRSSFFTQRKNAVLMAAGSPPLPPGSELPEAVAAAAASPSPSPVPLLGPWLPPTPISLVPLGATWRYFDLGTLPAVDWQLPAYDDSAWAQGPAQLGYGDGDEATVIASGQAGAYYPAAWFRHTFTVANPAALPTARVRVLCDDGAAVYVNGVEVGRWNMANGPIVSTSPASLAVTGTAEGDFHVFAFPPSLLVAGTNVVAVEVHQVSPTSSDLSFDCEVLAGAGPITVLRGPYLQNGTPSRAVVRWRTDQPTATQLWLGPTAATMQPAYFDAVLRTNHTATVTGLAAETTYAYAIGDAAGTFAGVPPATLRTLPPAGAARPMRAWVLGDAGFGWLPQYVVRDAYAAFAGSQRADAILMLGDNAYLIGTDAEYQVGLFDVYGAFLRDTFTWSTLGNHDAYSCVTATESGPYYDIFSLPRAGEGGGLPSGTEAYYSFDRGHVHFVCLDSMDSDRAATGAMMTWLQADLANTTARWIIAFFHHPPYSAGSHPSDDPLDSGGRLFDMRQVALPILEAGGVDLVMSGHSHSYERSRLIDGHYGTSATLQPSMVRDRGDGRPNGDGYYGKPTAGKAPHEGAVFVVAGSAGSVAGGQLNHPAMYVSLNNFGSFVFDIDGDRLDAKFVGLSGIEDEFTLVKGDPRTLRRDQLTISVSNGGRQDLQLDAGPALAGYFYILGGSYGTSPGFPFGTLHVPLNPDPWLQLSLALANTPVYPNSIGILDANGRANTALVLPSLHAPQLAGVSMWHAFVLGDGVSLVHASNAVKVTLVP